MQNTKQRLILAVLAGALGSFIAFTKVDKITGAQAADPYQNHLPIYTDRLENGWTNWSWLSTINLSASPAQSGSNSLSANLSFWGGVYLHTDTVADLSKFEKLSFQLLSKQSNKKFFIIFYDANNNMIGNPRQLSDFGGDTSINEWKKYEIPVSQIGAGQIKGFAIQEALGQGSTEILLDEIHFLAPVVVNNDIPSQPLGNWHEVYKDSLNQAWQNWSWGGGINFGSIVEFTTNSPWAGFYLHNDNALNTNEFTSLNFDLKQINSDTSYKIGIYNENNQPIGDFKLVRDFEKQALSDGWKNYSVDLKSLGVNLVKGFAIQDTSGGTSAKVFIDNIYFSSQSSQTLPTIPEAPAPLEPAPTPAPNPEPIVNTGGYTVQNGQIFKNGQRIKLHGVSWFGFETETHSPHGLWIRNYKDMISQMKSLGINAVRLPFNPSTLHSSNVTGIDTSINPDLAGLNSLQVLDKIVGEFNNQQIYVLLDHHRPDDFAISQLWYTGNYSEQDWINDLKMISARYKDMPYLMGMDIKNEPHGSATWGTGNSGTDWNLAAEKAGREILSVNPNVLIFVEGVQDNPVCSSGWGHWMGGNLEPQACAPISTNAIPANKLVFSPHVYGPDVYFQSYFGDSNFPANMPAIWDKHFGFLKDQGFSIVPGEWGGKYGNGGDYKDKVWQDAFVNYMVSKGICDSFYWDWNPNSGDTGGVLQDDWNTPWSNKVQLLQNYFNSCN